MRKGYLLVNLLKNLNHNECAYPFCSSDVLTDRPVCRNNRLSCSQRIFRDTKYRHSLDNSGRLLSDSFAAFLHYLTRLCCMCHCLWLLVSWPMANGPQPTHSGYDSDIPLSDHSAGLTWRLLLSGFSASLEIRYLWNDLRRPTLKD